MKNDQTNPTPNKPRLPIWLIIIILLILAIVFVTILILWQQKSDVKNNINSSFELEKTSVPATTIKKEVYLYIGEILKINKQNITFKALALNNSLPEDVEMLVRFDQNTSFTFLIIPATLTGDYERDQIITSPTNSSNLKNGQTISVRSLENISNSTEFLASQIQIHTIR